MSTSDDIDYFRKNLYESLKIRSEHLNTDPRVDEALAFVYGYASHVDDWVTIKKELLKALNSELRMLFSTRDPVTKKQRTNDFERSLIARWTEMSGRDVILK